jgi:hypothetical protein
MVGDGAPLVGCTIATNGEQAVIKISGPKVMNFAIRLLDVVFLYMFISF